MGVTKYRWAALAVLTAILVLSIALSWDTRGAMSQLPFLRQEGKVAGADPNAKTLVDIQPWQTAAALAALAGSAEEARYAGEAEHLADHEVDQAFAAGLREAGLQPQHLTGEALWLSKKVEALEQTVREDQARVRELTARDPDDDLDIAKAQLDLDADQLTDAKQDMVRAGGDESARIQQELATHESAMKNTMLAAAVRPRR